MCGELIFDQIDQCGEEESSKYFDTDTHIQSLIRSISVVECFVDQICTGVILILKSLNDQG